LRQQLEKTKQFITETIIQKDELIHQKEVIIEQKDEIIEQQREIIEQNNDMDNNVNNENNESKKLYSSKYEKNYTRDGDDYIYLLKEREFIKTKECIYKIGRTEKGYRKRVDQYPNGSKVFVIIKVPDSIKYEKVILEIFKIKFRRRLDIGSEYFEANILDIRKELYKIIRRLDRVYD
jgi:hypothetical protein